MCDDFGKDHEADWSEKFAHEYLGRFISRDESYKRAYKAWLNFYDQLEEFQQKVCRGRNERGIAIPQGLEEMRLSNQKSRLLRQELVELLRVLNIPRETENSARQLALREHELKWTRR
jgi:hypothetical protein